jgi:hypothetical protein
MLVVLDLRSGSNPTVKFLSEVPKNMRDLLIGLAFVVMLLTPALVASFHRRNDE